MSAILNTIILLGALQGFIISVLLWKRSPSQQANWLLSALIFLIALASLKVYSNSRNWWSSIPFGGLIEALVPFIIVMPVGPLIYFYIQAYNNPDFRLTKQQRRHFYPVFLDLVPQLIAIIYIIGIFSRLLKVDNARWGDAIDDYNTYVDIPRWLSITIYLWLSARYLRKKSSLSPGTADEHARWLRLFIRIFLVFQTLWFIFLIPYVIPGLTYKLLDLVDWYPIYVPLAIMIYWLGIKGYIMSYRATVAEKKAANTQVILPAATIQATSTALRKAMEEDKLFLNPNLDLSLLSKHTGIVPKTISAVLNQHLHKSFNEFVNEYRVHAIKERLLQQDSRNLTIAGIAYECGFNSLPTFQRAFKSVIGVSPSEFMAKNAS